MTVSIYIASFAAVPFYKDRGKAFYSHDSAPLQQIYNDHYKRHNQKDMDQST